MNPPITCYLRTHRRRWELTQRELAFLLGINSPSQISRYEHVLCQPTARILIACEVIFSEHPSALFPALYSEIEEEVMRRALSLFEEIERPDGRYPSAKRDLLLRMATDARSHCKDQSS